MLHIVSAHFWDYPVGVDRERESRRTHSPSIRTNAAAREEGVKRFSKSWRLCAQFPITTKTRSNIGFRRTFSCSVVTLAKTIRNYGDLSTFISIYFVLNAFLLIFVDIQRSFCHARASTEEKLLKLLTKNVRTTYVPNNKDDSAHAITLMYTTL